MEKARHFETESSSVSSGAIREEVKEEVRQVTNLTAKEQYSKLWTAIKADKRFCL